jgi:hypothetical protein
VRVLKQDSCSDGGGVGPSGLIHGVEVLKRTSALWMGLEGWRGGEGRGGGGFRGGLRREEARKRETRSEENFFFIRA